MSNFIGVRIARRDEVDQIYDLLLELHAENGLFSLDPVKARQTIVDLLDPKFGIIGVIDGPSGLEGSIGLFRASWYYTTDPHLSEFWNFVRADCRRSNHAKRLIQFGKWASDNLGIPLHMGIVTTTRAEAKQRLYRRLLKPVGAYYMYGDTPRLGDEITAVAEKEATAAALLEEMHGAAKKLINSGEPNGNGRASQKRKVSDARHRRDALNELKSVVGKADALNGVSH